jgi:carboxymethylenebutenolidase
MRKILMLLFSIVIISNTVVAQKKCCSSDKDAMAKFTNKKGFRDAHAEPLSYVHENGLGKKITFPTADGKTGNAYEVKTKVKSDKYLFVIHEWWGLNDYIMKESDKFFSGLKDVNIIAVDLFDGKVATTKEDAAKQMNALDTKRATAIIEGALKYVGPNSKIASIGWCMGGGWALQTALLAGKRDIGCVMFYGMPEENVDKLKNLNSDVLFIWAKKDQWINQDVVTKFEKNMKEAGKTLTVKAFDADHAFANPSNPQFDKKATEEANKLAMDYLKNHLK